MGDISCHAEILCKRTLFTCSSGCFFSGRVCLVRSRLIARWFVWIPTSSSNLLFHWRVLWAENSPHYGKLNYIFSLLNCLTWIYWNSKWSWEEDDSWWSSTWSCSFQVFLIRIIKITSAITGDGGRSSRKKGNELHIRESSDVIDGQSSFFIVHWMAISAKETVNFDQGDVTNFIFTGNYISLW